MVCLFIVLFITGIMSFVVGGALGGFIGLFSSSIAPHHTAVPMSTIKTLIAGYDVEQLVALDNFRSLQDFLGHFRKFKRNFRLIPFGNVLNILVSIFLL